MSASGAANLSLAPRGHGGGLEVALAVGRRVVRHDAAEARELRDTQKGRLRVVKWGRGGIGCREGERKQRRSVSWSGGDPTDGTDEIDVIDATDVIPRMRRRQEEGATRAAAVRGGGGRTGAAKGGGKGGGTMRRTARRTVVVPPDGRGTKACSNVSTPIILVVAESSPSAMRAASNCSFFVRLAGPTRVLLRPCRSWEEGWESWEGSSHAISSNRDGATGWRSCPVGASLTRRAKAGRTRGGGEFQLECCPSGAPRATGVPPAAAGWKRLGAPRTSICTVPPQVPWK